MRSWCRARMPQLDPEEIRTHCRSLIAGYKVPRSVEIRTAPLPLSGSGKVLKPALRQEYAARPDACEIKLKLTMA